MGTSPTEPFRFSLNFPSTSNQKNPSSSALTSPRLLAKKRPAVLNASSNCGLTSKRTTSKTPKTSNSSTPTKRWQRYSDPTAFVPSVWPNSSQLTCQPLLKYCFCATCAYPSFMDLENILGWPCIYLPELICKTNPNYLLISTTGQKKHLKFYKTQATFFFMMNKNHYVPQEMPAFQSLMGVAKKMSERFVAKFC